MKRCFRYTISYRGDPERLDRWLARLVIVRLQEEGYLEGIKPPPFVVHITDHRR